MSLLAIRGVMKHFGGVMAVDTVSFDIAAGELVGLIGPNGSGKTTLLNMLSGHLKPNAGEVLLDGEPCQGLKPENPGASRRDPHVSIDARLFPPQRRR